MCFHIYIYIYICVYTHIHIYLHISMCIYVIDAGQISDAVGFRPDQNTHSKR